MRLGILDWAYQDESCHKVILEVSLGTIDLINVWIFFRELFFFFKGSRAKEMWDIKFWTLLRNINITLVNITCFT